MLLLNDVRPFLKFYVVREQTHNILDTYTSLHAECSTSHINVGADNHLLHTDKGAYSYTWTMNEQIPKPVACLTIAFQVSVVFNNALKVVIELVMFWSEMTTISKQSISF